jgi:hypothetical protein
VGSTQWRSGPRAGTLRSMKTRCRRSTFLIELYCLSLLTKNGQNIPFVNNVKYLSVIFDRKITWRLYIKTIETKTFRAVIRTYSLFKSEHLSANIKLILYKAATKH